MPSYNIHHVLFYLFFKQGILFHLFIFLDCTNLNSFLLCLHMWHFLVECTMDLVETVIGGKALSILLAYWKDGISVCSLVDRS